MLPESSLKEIRLELAVINSVVPNAVPSPIVKESVLSSKPT